MKIILTLITSMTLLIANLQAIQLAGSAVTSNISNISAGDSTFVVVDLNGGNLDILDEALSNSNTVASLLGENFKAGATIGDMYIASYNAAVGGFGVSIAGNATFNLGDGGTAAGDKFYIIGFNGITSSDFNAAGGNTFDVVSEANWVLPSNNSGTYQWPTDFTNAAAFDGSTYAVPEASSFALISGFLAMSYVMLRRR